MIEMFVTHRYLLCSWFTWYRNQITHTTTTTTTATFYIIIALGSHVWAP